MLSGILAWALHLSISGCEVRPKPRLCIPLPWTLLPGGGKWSWPGTRLLQEGLRVGQRWCWVWSCLSGSLYGAGRYGKQTQSRDIHVWWGVFCYSVSLLIVSPLSWPSPCYSFPHLPFFCLLSSSLNAVGHCLSHTSVSDWESHSRLS